MASAAPKVLITRNLPAAGRDLLREHGFVIEQWQSDDPIPRDTLMRMIADKDACLAVVTDRFDAAVFDVAPHLRVVANFATGFDNLDVAEATRRGILLTNTPDVLTHSTADFAFALLMTVARNIVPSAAFIKRGEWTAWRPMYFLGQDVHHATLGVIGLGRIGREVARRGTGFQMRVIYHGSHRDPDAERDFGAEYRGNVDDLLREADFISLHVPLTDRTRHLIDDHALGLMKPNAVLVNTSRGPVVDQDALYRALSEGRIRGAALDVTDPEPLPADHPLLSLPNCLIVPHIASATVETRDAMCLLAARNIVAAFAGERPPTPINPEVLVGKG
jgi:glyoxylate reductase